MVDYVNIPFTVYSLLDTLELFFVFPCCKVGKHPGKGLDIHAQGTNIIEPDKTDLLHGTDYLKAVLQQFLLCEVEIPVGDFQAFVLKQLNQIGNRKAANLLGNEMGAGL